MACDLCNDEKCCKEKEKPFVDEAVSLVYGGGRDYSHPLIQHLNAGMRQAIRNKDDKWCDPISIAENQIYMKESRNDGKEKVDNRTDSIGYTLCIGMMCELFWEMGFCPEGDTETALRRLRNLTFPAMWSLYIEAIRHLEEKGSVENVNFEYDIVKATN